MVRRLLSGNLDNEATLNAAISHEMLKQSIVSELVTKWAWPEGLISELYIVPAVDMNVLHIISGSFFCHVNAYFDVTLNI
jgi:hypothetical protein